MVERARAVADAVLFEGYALYPYRPSSKKNVSRWQFGVVAPRSFAEDDGGDPWWMEAQCLIESIGEPRVRGELRFLRLRRRQVLAPEPVDSIEIEGRLLLSWDEGELHEVHVESGAVASETPFDLAADIESEPAGRGVRVERTRSAVTGVVSCALDRASADRPCWKLRVRVENLSPWRAGGTRDQAMGASLLGAHLLLCVTEGKFVSLIDPPRWAEAAAAECKNVRVFPVLAGKREARDVVLASPIILYDYPEVAPESPGDLFDVTEIDEILTLRTRTLTDDEKREACAGDPRVAALVARAEALSTESLERLHGTFRALRPDGHATADASSDAQDPRLLPGVRVRLRPGARRSDAQDMFLAGMLATVRSVMRHVDGRICLAVTVDDDPAAELLLANGRFRYFYADEVEPLESDPDSACAARAGGAESNTPDQSP